jgi:SAM-dependent methyltransferase
MTSTSAVARWQEKLATVHAHNAQTEPTEQRRGGIWDQRRSTWFNRFAGQSDRSDTFCFMEQYVHGQVLEIGPGPGAYTRLLAERADHVTAVDSSAHMLAYLRENLAEFDNIETVECPIEDYLDQLERYDFALAANVLGGIVPIDQVLRRVAAHAAIFAIVMWSNAITPDWSKAVQLKVLGRTVVDPDRPTTDDLEAVLEELHLSFESHVADMPVHTFVQRSDVVDWVEGFHGIDPAQRPQLESVLDGFIEERGGKFGLPNSRHTVVVIVHDTGQ